MSTSEKLKAVTDPEIPQEDLQADEDFERLKELEGAEPPAPAEPSGPASSSIPASEAPPSGGRMRGESRGDPAIALREKNREISELKKQLQVTDARTRALLEKVFASQPPPPPPPNVNDDPVGYLRHREDYTEARLAQLVNRQTQMEVENFRGKTNEAGRASFEDWDQATAHLQTQLRDLYIDLGYDPVTAHNEMVGHVTQALVLAAQTGRSPHEVVYGMARRFGYGSAAGGRGGARLDQIRRGTEAARSLGGAGGRRGAGRGTPSPSDIRGMSEEEFLSLCDDPAAWRAAIEQAEKG
ncbi:MAG: hypothetical protein AB1405_02300 [Bdellovibrionota bacterium]